MNDIVQKQCTYCKQFYPTTLQFFYKHKQHPDGLQPRCKDCFGKGREPREEYIDGKKRCRKCNTLYPPTSEFFGELHVSADKLSYYCHLCDRERAEQRNRQRGAQPRKPADPQGKQKWYKQNKQSIYRRIAKWQQEHPEQTRKNKMRYQQSPRGRIHHTKNQLTRHARELGAQGSYTYHELMQRYQQQDGKCFYCGVDVGRHFHADHYIPLAKGGSNFIENIVIACPPCNCSKKDSYPWEWSPRKHLF